MSPSYWFPAHKLAFDWKPTNLIGMCHVCTYMCVQYLHGISVKVPAVVRYLLWLTSARAADDTLLAWGDNGVRAPSMHHEVSGVNREFFPV